MHSNIRPVEWCNGCLPSLHFDFAQDLPFTRDYESKDPLNELIPHRYSSLACHMPLALRGCLGANWSAEVVLEIEN